MQVLYHHFKRDVKKIRVIATIATSGLVGKYGMPYGDTIYFTYVTR
jgi:hypothetical protein